MPHDEIGKTALLLLDLQNEMVDAKGYFGAAGMAKVVDERGVLSRSRKTLDAARAMPTMLVSRSKCSKIAVQRATWRCTGWQWKKCSRSMVKSPRPISSSRRWPVVDSKTLKSRLPAVPPGIPSDQRVI